VRIDVKFVSVVQTVSKGLNFRWFSGTNPIGGSIGVGTGPAPSYQATPSVANPSGIFPGPAPVGSNPGQIAPSASDGDVTPGLRSIAPGATAPTNLATMTGILTDPQFLMTIKALEQRAGATIASAATVTTTSGRQAHITIHDDLPIVTTVPTNAPNLSSNSINPIYEGPSVDVLPTVSLDGYSIQMVAIPILTDPNGIGPEGPGHNLKPVVIAANVWDGQTVMIGGLIAESHPALKQPTNSQLRNLIVFITARIVDPAGNPVHTDAEMPFAKQSIPPQPTPGFPK
jgi:general secretion pathway protein D